MSWWTLNCLLIQLKINYFILSHLLDEFQMSERLIIVVELVMMNKAT